MELREMGLLAVLLPFVLTPGRMEVRASHWAARFMLRGSGQTLPRRTRVLPPELVAAAGVSARVLLQRQATQEMRERIRLLRGVVMPWWRRKVSLRGFEHAQAALDGGHGAVLWAFQCVPSNVGVKQALFEAGHPVHQLSRPGHPLSDRRFSVRFVNPLLRRPEDRFLAERIFVEGKRTTGPLRRMRAALEANQLVCITVVPEEARQLVRMRVLGGTYAFATGPAQLAAAAGAPLLPVFSWCAADLTVVEVGEPLALAGRSDAAIRETLAAAASWLDGRAKAHPEAWKSWRSGAFQRAGGEP
jgi:predicted LPLAT superfamily acyltransferase